MRDYQEQDYYELLEVTPEATAEEIGKAYERMKAIFGAEAVGTYAMMDDVALEPLKERLEDAYRTLNSETLRTRYDDLLGIKRERPPPQEPEEESTLSHTGMPLETAISYGATGAEPLPTAPPVSEAPPPQQASPREEARREPTQEAPFEVKQPQAQEETQEYSGSVLRGARDKKGIALEDIAKRTKISLSHLVAIESNDFARLPSRVYVRGFVAQYAKYLGLPMDRVSESYLMVYDRFVQAKK